jgi:uncharacterized protein (TIGR02246 family)
MKLTIFVLLAGLAHGTPVHATALPDPTVPASDWTARAQLRTINHRFIDAFREPAVEFMDNLTDTNFLLTTARGEWLERSAHLSRMSTRSGLVGVSYDGVSIRHFGDVALVHGTFEGLDASGGTMRVRYTDAYRHDGDEWRLVSAQNTPLQDSAPLELIRGTMPVHAPWQGEDPKGDDLAVLTELNERYVQAFRESDVAWYAAHLAPDYVVIQPDGSMLDRAAALQAFARPVFATRMRSFPVDQVRIRRFGDVALIHAQNDYELLDGREGISRYTDIWVKREGRWTCVAAHLTTYKAPR